jgi:4-hydroxy-tetrahydrodipicolinate synthase
MATPFHEDGGLDLDGAAALARWLVAQGNDGLVVAGTTGEAPTLSDEERLQLFAAAVEAVGGRASVVAGTGTYSTAHSVHLTREAESIGVDGYLVVTPYYNKPPVRGTVAHFAAIANETDKPIIVYNIPQRVVINLEPEALAQLAEIPNVQYVKQTTTDLEQARRIVEEIGLTLYAGNDDLLLPFLELGGKGGVFVFTHIVGPQVKDLIGRYNDGDRKGASSIADDLQPVIDALAVTTNPIPVKAALNMLGHEVGGLRLPLVEATGEEKEKIRAGLERAGVAAPARV